jgi:hypothetical protein
MHELNPKPLIFTQLAQVARRREAASAFDAEIQKRARSFYRDRLGALLAGANDPAAGARS